MATITAANSVYMLSIAGLFPTPQQLQGYSADDAFSTDAVEPAEVVMGVDGRMSAGYIPRETPQTISLMPDSPSDQMFDAWLSAQKLIREIYFANGLITLTSIGRTYVLTRGVLTSIPPIVSAKKVLQARTFRITWETVAPVPV